MLLLFTMFLGFSTALANCSGCCYGHGGVTCEGQVTQCRDGSKLTPRCLEKSCNKCGPRQKNPVHASRGAYRREDWMPQGWIDIDRDCLRTRDEVLHRDNLQRVTGKAPCKVKAGQWKDFYAPEVVVDDPKLVDIDHVVALKEAHDYGGATWPRDRKLAFAQDMQNLVVTRLRTNREKGGQSPATWLPGVRQADVCRYLEKWKGVVAKYSLVPSFEVQRRVDHTWSTCGQVKVR